MRLGHAWRSCLTGGVWWRLAWRSPVTGGHEVRAGMENSCSGWETEGELCVDKQDMIMGSTGRMRGRSNVTV